MSAIEILTPFRPYIDKLIVVKVRSVKGATMLEKLTQTHSVYLNDKIRIVRSFIGIDLRVDGIRLFTGLNITVQSDAPLVIRTSIVEGV